MVSHPFPPTALRRHHAQTVRDRCSSYKIDYVVVIKKFLNPEGHQNPVSGLKVTAILLKWRILPIGGASAVEGLRSMGLPRLINRCTERQKINRYTVRQITNRSTERQMYGETDIHRDIGTDTEMYGDADIRRVILVGLVQCVTPGHIFLDF